MEKSSELNFFRFLFPIAYSPGIWIQYPSLEFANHIWTKDFNYFTTRPTWLSTTNLEPPYETNCFDYDISSPQMCIMDCVERKTMRSLGKIPNQVVIQEPQTTDSLQPEMELKRLDELNYEESVTIYLIWDQCEKNECPKRDCSIKLTSSYSTKDYRPQFDSFEFLLGVSSAPDTIIFAEANMRMNEFLIYILSCAGSWFRFSLLARSPSQV